jgi:cytochrome c2
MGGDELNVILPGRNYGWPTVTYGTEPGVRSWGTDSIQRNHGEYEEPRTSWIPSVGISNLIEVGGRQFPGWEGDLLVASLNGASLFRVRQRDGNVAYVERIYVGGRLRDLLEDPTGRIVVLKDDGVVVTISNGGDDRTGEVVFGGCATCHAPQGGGPALGPDLRGLFGRLAGRQPGFDYSPAFRALQMPWSPERLDAFLADPTGFVPGTRMVVPPLSESDREAVIDFLWGYD